jgi:hypothetical protein
VLRNICVLKIIKNKLSKTVNHSYHTKGFCWPRFAYGYHCPNVISFSLRKRD